MGGFAVARESTIVCDQEGLVSYSLTSLVASLVARDQFRQVFVTRTILGPGEGLAYGPVRDRPHSPAC